MMESKGSTIYCSNCNKTYNLNEDGTLTSLQSETEFSHLPDWYNWQRENVKQEILNNTYYFEDEVDVYSLPRTAKPIHLGKAKVTHTIENGFILEGFYNKQPYRIIRKPLASNSLHVEYDYVHIKPYDCFVINTEDDCFFCYTSKKDVITKLGFATEEIYQYHLNKKNK